MLRGCRALWGELSTNVKGLPRVVSQLQARSPACLPVIFWLWGPLDLQRFLGWKQRQPRNLPGILGRTRPDQGGRDKFSKFIPEKTPDLGMWRTLFLAQDQVGFGLR